MAQQESNPFGKFLVGAGVGIAMTWGYVRFGFELPGIADLPGKITSAAISMTADTDLENWDLPLEARQRAASVIFANNPDRLIEIDNALNHALLKEMWRSKAVRRARIANATRAAYDEAFDRPALREMYERKFQTRDREQIRQRLFARDLREDEFLHGYLVEFWPDETPAEHSARVRSVAEHQLQPPLEWLAADDEHVSRR